PGRFVQTIAISPDGARLASASADTVTLWDARLTTASGTNPWQADATWRQAWSPSWHALDAALAEKSGNTFAACFHLDRLARYRPWDGSVQHRCISAWI